MDQNKQVALSHAKAGRPVFPCGPDKRPLVKWRGRATTVPAQIERWWNRWPDAMPGLPMGRASELAVLDLDKRPDKDGAAALRDLGFDPDSLSPCIIATPSGGQHIYFQWPEGLGNSAAGLPAGVDVRGEGGYVIAPGAVNGSGAYSGELTSDLLPDWPEGLRPARSDAPEAVSGEREGQPFNVIREAVMAIPNTDATRDLWTLIGFGLHFETEGSGEGLELFQEWSKLHRDYDDGKTDYFWRTVKRGKGNMRTFATIRAEARKHGWIDPTFTAEIDISGFDNCLTAYELAEIDDLVGIPTPEVQAEGRNLTRAYALDEDGVIRAFTDRHQNELQFDHHAARWYRFDGQHWQREETLLAKHYARELSTTLAARDPRAKALKKVGVWEAIERGARTAREFACTGDRWDSDTFLLGTPSGTVDLKTGRLRKACPADYISKITAAAPVPLDSFDPTRDCPQWLAFLDEALGGDAGAIRFLQQWGGYSLTGDTREHALVFVYGPGGSGKSTAINTISDVAGDYSITVDTSTLTAQKHDAHKQEIARLDGARLAWASETEKGRAWAENRIKSLTGGDTITANFMRQNSFEFTPQLKLTIIGNNRPSLTDVDAAIRRRFIVLPFDHPPTTKDTELPAKLKAEWPGILSWLIVGALDWKQNGLIRPALVEDATNEYFDDQDTFGQWLDECCELGGPEGQAGLGYVATTDSLYTSWQHYAYTNGADPGTKMRTFPETMRQRGFTAVKNRGGIRGRGFAGIHLAVDLEGFTDDMV